ncbi:PhoH family protein [Pauljensenia hongkongensis]|uniref:PhoH-like protein n=1 Tax=Pauljensenia hongkongensis TaxID=178339 RepID=A0A1D8B4E4_9ACTO|nr:PhoH family protein [Pauljensenia hongkongensis]AOS47996.1 phosphate starvation-inducible protein PhoH [Pauljensenia hongkongensis]
MSDPTVESTLVQTRRAMIPARLEPIMVLGVADQVLRALERGFPHVRFLVTGREISMAGVQADIDLAANLVEELIGLAGRGQALDADAVEQAISLLGRVTRGEAPSEEILSARGRSIRPKTPGQKAYTDAIDRSTVVFGIGPAGTGKTYLAMAQAVRRLLSGEARRIVLTRPAVEAGENLGFLPGSLTDKIDPYLRPLYDALGDMLDPEALPKLMAAGTIEVAPLAYMRGRTLNDSFIILDEAQNTTLGQMKMFLTRLGFGSKVVVTGDASQVDLPGGQPSGLAVIQTILEGVDGIEFCHLTSADVVRHELVGHIIDAYQRWEDGAARRRSARSRARHPREDRS